MAIYSRIFKAHYAREEMLTRDAESHQGPNRQTDPARQYVQLLSPQERMLVVLKRELYDNDWDSMQRDLENRLNGAPYVFRLASRIEDDLERIARLKGFEQAHDVNLSDYVDI